MPREMLSIAIRGDLRKQLRAEARLMRRAMTAALREAGTDLRDDLRADTSRGLGRKVGRKWRSRFYGRGRRTADMAALVYPNGGDRLRQMIDAAEHGATIRAVNGTYLAIPTNFNRAGGRKGGKVLFQPGELQESFVQRSRSGTLIIFAPVRQAQRQRKGRVQDLAFANGKLLGSGRRKATTAALAARAVPMFILKKSVRYPGGKISTTARAARIGRDLPARFVAAAERLENNASE